MMLQMIRSEDSSRVSNAWDSLSGSGLEGVLSFTVLADYDAQLQSLANDMATEVKRKQELRQKLEVLQQGNQQELEAEIEALQADLAEQNSASDLRSLQIQNLLEQRKHAMTLLSNLLSNRRDILSSIIANLKS